MCRKNGTVQNSHKMNLVTKLKYLIFGIINNMLKFQSRSYLKYTISQVIIFIQILYFPLQSFVTYLSKQ